jgi:phosphatidyl-myo-inositol dimannoside synthase
MRIAFHVPRAEYLESCPGGENHTSGDGMTIANLLEALRKRGHRLNIVSRLDARDFWLGRLPARRLLAEAALVRGEMKRFSPDAWLIYCPTIQSPDLFGWWQHPRRYMILKGGEDSGGGKKVKALPRLWRKLYAYAYRHSLQRADRIEAKRPKAVQHLRSWGVSEERISFLPHAIKGWTRIPCREEARRVLGLPQEATTVLCVSRFSVRRYEGDTRPGKTESILDLMRAFTALPADARLLLVGEGRGRGQIEDETARLKLRGRVLLAGEVEHCEVSWYYAACDFFACPEKAESNRPTQAFLEAQACGRPVVTMQTEFAQMTAEAGRTGLLAKDLNEFKAHLLALSQDRKRCDEMGRAAAAFVARSFSIDARARQIDEFLFGRKDVSTAGREAMVNEDLSPLEERVEV